MGITAQFRRAVQPSLRVGVSNQHLFIEPELRRINHLIGKFGSNDTGSTLVKPICIHWTSTFRGRSPYRTIANQFKTTVSGFLNAIMHGANDVANI